MSGTDARDASGLGFFLWEGQTHTETAESYIRRAGCSGKAVTSYWPAGFFERKGGCVTRRDGRGGEGVAYTLPARVEGS